MNKLLPRAYIFVFVAILDGKMGSFWLIIQGPRKVSKAALGMTLGSIFDADQKSLGYKKEINQF